MAVGLLIAITKQNAIPYEDLLLDPSQYQGRPWYTGLVSNLGVLAWTVAAAAATGGAWIANAARRHGATAMLRGGALLTTLLLLDDLFQLHIIVPKTLGLPKVSFYGLYLVLSVWWLSSSWFELRRTRRLLLTAAVIALGCSVLFDQVAATGGGLVAEDSAKFLGILAWALYFVTTTRDIARSVLNELLARSSDLQQEILTSRGQT